MHGHLKPVKLQDSSFKTIGAITEASSKRNSYLQGETTKKHIFKSKQITMTKKVKKIKVTL